MCRPMWVVQVRSRFTGDTLANFCKAMQSIGFQKKAEDSSNLMFVVLEFVKAGQGMGHCRTDWPQLKACVYKHR